MRQQVLVVENRIVDRLNCHNRIAVFKSYDQVEAVLNEFGSFRSPEAAKSMDNLLVVVAFAVVRHGQRILVATRAGEMILGFGRKIMVGDSWGNNPSKTLIVAHTVWDELDLYIPKAEYEVRRYGMIYSDEREVDRESIGVVFDVELKSAIKPCTTQGKLLSLVSCNDIQRLNLEGWSRIIREAYSKNCTKARR